MAKIILVLPKLPQRLGMPYIGQQYVAASLLRDGHDVRCLDLAAARCTMTDQDVVSMVQEWQADMIGMTLFTQNAGEGYRLAALLKTCTGILVAGGPHPTACAQEALEYGFDVVIKKEGERAILPYARLSTQGSIDSLPVIGEYDLPNEQGSDGRLSTHVDEVPLPMQSYQCYQNEHYSSDGPLVAGGLVTSRGCPAKCTFCANSVTGRQHRFRGTQHVIEEMILLRQKYAVLHFTFFDDAFTANRSRVHQLCEAILAEPQLQNCTWTCNSPANMVNRNDLSLMKKAGCLAITFGIESGDKNILRTIKKGQRPEHILAAVKTAKSYEMTTIVNIMCGFPGEGVTELDNTFQLMEQLAQYTDFFNNAGVLVPFPGTELYEEFHEQYGFSNWWLQPKYIHEEPNFQALSPAESQKYLEHDPMLDMDFFRYDEPVKNKIAECVHFKAMHNQRRMGLL